MFHPAPVALARTMIGNLALPMAVPLRHQGMLFFPKNAISEFKRLGRHHCHIFSARRMPHLLKKLALVCAAVALILLPKDHVNYLYSAVGIANALNVAADVDGNDAINAGIDVTLLLRAFSHEGEADYEVPYFYNLFSRGGELVHFVHPPGDQAWSKGAGEGEHPLPFYRAFQFGRRSQEGEGCPLELRFR